MSAIAHMLNPESLDLLRRRIKASVRIDQRTECWLWTGCKNPNGYGRMRFQGRYGYAHRFAYVAFRSQQPGSCDIHHQCGNRACVNPEHLVRMTRTQLVRENIRQGRGYVGRRVMLKQGGEKSTFAKLTWEIVRSIRADDRPSAILAREHGITQNNIQKIRRYETWKEGFALL